MLNAYVLITPARNEEAYIEKTIQSVISQTILPKKWIIVSDGSTDRTDEIVKRYEENYDFIQFVRMSRGKADVNWSSSSKARALSLGYEQVRNIDYDFIGTLDADVSFEKEYFQFLLEKFAELPKLGIAGTPHIEDEHDIYRRPYSNLEHVHGACQLFRRKCFDEIGGLIGPANAAKGRGQHVVAVTMARMRGWRAKSFTEKTIFHHRKMGTANKGIISAGFEQGRYDYLFGNLLLWEVLRATHQMKAKPYILGGLSVLSGYLWSFLKQEKRPFPQELVKFRRREQTQRLKSIIYNIFGRVKLRSAVCHNFAKESAYSYDDGRNDLNTRVINSINSLDKWLQFNKYKGYEPYDGLSSYLRPLTIGNCFAERVLEQVVLRCPFHIRSLLGIKQHKHATGMGLLARGYLRLYILRKDIEFKNKAVYCLDWLIGNQSSSYSGYCWGLGYDYASRGGQIPKYVPNVVSTCIIGQAFLDAYEILADKRYLDVAISICVFILKDLPREETRNGSCISYVPFEQRSIHNSNMLAAAMLARTAKYTDDKAAFDTAQDAVQYTCERQIPNGAWYYGEEPKYKWIDNWHTAYNLDSLKCYLDNTNDKSFEQNLHRGFKFYTDNFFQKSGKPKYYFDHLYLVDIQSASQAIDTLSYFAEYEKSSLQLALKVADWTIRNMQDDSGYFYYRKLRWKNVKVPMVRWGQATMFCALTHLLSKVTGADGSLQ
jgi:glycosyltransferase involved in cell wall biosynthesis